MNSLLPWCSLLLPLVSAIAITLFTHRSRALSSFISIGAVLGSFVCSCLIFTRQGISAREFNWIDFVGVFRVPFGFVLDNLSKTMLVLVSGVGSLIHIYSLGYMRDDEGKSRYFAALSLFMFAMLGIVLSNNFVMLFIFWELVGFTSYVLIGHWFERDTAADAAKKAFITTRIGDFGFMLGILMVWAATGSVVFAEIAPRLSILTSHPAFLTTASLLIFCGAVGKSAQFPLHVWLPDAMEGPTPVSALIHAATMVAAGVFLVARVYPLFSLGAVNGVTPSLTVVVSVGVVTALMASLIALAQFDIKRILAYSTVSQLGLMMVSLGVGGVAAGIMHLIAHGFFKALLFLGAGSVIHGLHHEQDIRKMGGLRWIMPVTFLTYAVGMMNLSGVPFFFSGGWTKEEILHRSAHWPVSPLPHYLMLAGVILTALYMTRQMIYIFFGSARNTDFQSVRPAEFHSAEAATTRDISVGRKGQRPVFRAHESPRVMTMPLIVLALCSILFFLVLTPAWPWLHAYLNGEPAHVDFGLLIQPMLFLSLALVAGGIGFGWLIYRNVTESDPLARAQPGVFRFLENKMWFDEIYEHTVIALSRMLSRKADWLDRYFWDGLVRLFAGLGQAFGALSKGFDDHGINAGVDETTAGTRGFGRLIAAAHSGQIQAYLAAIAIGMLLLLVLYAWLG